MISRLRCFVQNFTPPEGLVAPCTDLEDEPDVKYFIDMSTVSDKVRKGTNARISQVFQINRMKMNRFGAKAESAAGMAITFECARVEVRPPVVIDKPFVIWFERPGFATPIFEAWVPTADWKEPEDEELSDGEGD